MKLLTNIFMLAAVVAVVLCSCNKTESEITEFVQGFAQAVDDGNRDEIAKCYPSASEIDSLVINFDVNSMKIVDEGSSTFLVEVCDGQDLTIERSEDGAMKIIKSHGLGAYDASRFDFAVKTGQYKSDLDDLENAARMADTLFISYLKEKTLSQLSEGLKIVSQRVTKYGEGEGGFGAPMGYSATVANNTNSAIAGSAYSVVITGKDYYIDDYMNARDTYDAHTLDGVDLAPGEQHTFSYNYSNQVVVGFSAKLKLKLDGTDLLNSLQLTGNEYDLYIKSKNGE